MTTKEKLEKEIERFVSKRENSLKKRYNPEVNVRKIAERDLENNQYLNILKAKLQQYNEDVKMFEAGKKQKCKCEVCKKKKNIEEIIFLSCGMAICKNCKKKKDLKNG